MSDDIKDIVKGIISSQVVSALNNSPEAIEKLVASVLSKPVDASGNVNGYGAKMPYLDWMIGNEIRMAAVDAVRKILQEQCGTIENEVRKGLSSETVVSAITKSLVKSSEETWRINVSFEAEK